MWLLHRHRRSLLLPPRGAGDHPVGGADPGDSRGTDCDRFDPASAALMEKLNYVVSLLETQRTHSASSAPAITPGSISNTVSPGWPVIAQDHIPQLPPQVLSHCNLSCRVLMWPIISTEGYDAVLESLFLSEKSDPESRLSRPQSVTEEDFPAHARAFLANVHTKNPVVEYKTLMRYSNDAAENGVGWDGPSCLVLLTSALGIVSTTFQRVSTTQQAQPESNRELADACYFAARKRIGLLSATSLLYLQCHFLSGVYEMYNLRPLEAWHSFYVVSTAKPLYTRTRNPGLVDAETNDLEQRLFWSASKSEFVDDIPQEFPQEESWYYYLFEVSQQRTMYQVISSFYSSRQDTQLLEASVGVLTQDAIELERHQTLAGSRLPPWLQFVEGEASDRELPYFVRTRSLSVQDSILRPFLFLLIHSTTLQSPTIYGFAQRCLEGCYTLIDLNDIQHRHHGSWFQARAAFRCALTILAAKKSEKITVRSDWRHFIDVSLSVVEFWAKDADDLQRLAVVLRNLYDSMASYD
ncbi:unnamed protein product [Penicillium olsonii]|nr:unnamed protein product [Penicillium olsonii]